MGELFLILLNRSITAGWLILAVVLLRPLLRRAPKWIFCVLWGLVAIRLLCPFSIESAWSLIPSTQTVSTAPISPSVPIAGEQIVIQSGIPMVDSAVNPILGEVLPSAPASNSADPWQVATEIVGYIWAAGAIALALYACISYLRLHRKVRASLCKENRVFVCDEISSPFILGIVKPSIYLPSGMDAQTASYVLAHERAHLRRRDHWWKPFGYLLLTLYWFHPLVWLAYVLLCRDIELACDEKVIREWPLEEKAAYSQALLDCSGPRRLITVCPLAFGEVGVKARVKKVLHYKRPAFWILLVAMVACVVTAVCLLTDPKDNPEAPEKPTVQDYRDDGIYEDGNLYIANVIEIPETPPFPLPGFPLRSTVYRNRSILRTYVNVTEQAREEYYQTMREEGFSVETFDRQSFLFRDGCAVFLNYYEKTDGSVSAQCTYYVQRENVSAEELTPEQAKAIIGGDHPYDPIDVSPEKLYEYTGGQIFMQVELVNGHPSSLPNFYFVTSSSVQCLFDTPIAWADVDGNGIHELWTMTPTPNDPTISSLYYAVTAYESNAKKATADIRYGNQFAAHEGKLCLQSGTSEAGEPILYALTVANGSVRQTRVLNGRAEENKPIKNALVELLSTFDIHDPRNGMYGSASVGLADVNFDGIPEVLEAYPVTQGNRLSIHVYDLYSGVNIGACSLPCNGEEAIPDLCVYQSRNNGEYMTLCQGEYTLGGDKSFFAVYSIDQSTRSTVLFLREISDGRYYHLEKEVTEEEYHSYYEQFWSEYERIEPSKVQFVFWGTGHTDAEKKTKRAHELANALLGSDQSFVTLP